jgi:hypothetical protein
MLCIYFAMFETQTESLVSATVRPLHRSFLT